jgi:glycine/D-amino acid oxidase-like deaminating enzyme
VKAGQGPARAEPARGGSIPLLDEQAITADFKTTPYWWDTAPRPRLPEASLPPRVDIAVIGSGCTGLSAALALARAGRSVLVLEAGDPGQGASSRATGVLGRTLKHSFSAILKEEGEAAAKRAYGAARIAFDFILDVIGREAIDCDLRQCGRFMGANSPAHYEAMARDLEAKRRHLGDEYEMIPRAQQHREIASDLFHGGGVIPDHRQFHPGKYQRGLMARAQEAGAQIHARTAVTGLRRERDGFELRTGRGTVRASQVIAATNGYTGAATPFLQRRVIPLDAFMVATEPMAPERLRALIPQGRTFHDYTINADYGVPAPHEPRLLFGGLTGENAVDLPGKAVLLHARMLRFFPQLADVRLSHIWTGRCAATFDLYPHIGEKDGLHYGMGFCFGSGLPIGTWFGHIIAQRILGAKDAATAFDDLAFSTRLFYWGRPWFVPLAMRYYRWVDKRGF